jgi:hypothetical protein
MHDPRDARSSSQRTGPASGAPSDDRCTVPMERFQPPAAPLPDPVHTHVVQRSKGPAVAWPPRDATVPLPGPFAEPRAPGLPSMPRDSGPTAEPPGTSQTFPPSTPPTVVSQRPRHSPRALLGFALGTTVLALLLFAVSIVLHVKRRSRVDRPSPPSLHALHGVAPPPPPLAPSAPAPPTASPSSATVPAQPSESVERSVPSSAPPPRDSHRLHRRHPHAVTRHRHRHDPMPLWTVP